MLLRASSEHKGQEVDLKGVIGDAAGDGGVAHGQILVEFAEAVMGADATRLADAGQAVRAALGDAALVDSAAVAAGFNAIDRIADGTGIPIDEERLASTADFRKELGIDAFPSRTD